MAGETDFFVHETAVVDQPVQIGKGTKVWHFCHIMKNCVIGENCSFGQNVFIASGVKLGSNVKVQNNVSIYAGVECEDDVFLGPSMVLTNVINPRSGVVRKSEYLKTLLRKGVTIGANATIVCGITLGEYVFVGAGSVVTKSYPAYSLVYGNPGKHAGWMSEYGHRLEFDENGMATCPESGQRYMLKNSQVCKSE